MPEKPQKYEQEIEEIIRKAGKLRPRRSPGRAVRDAFRRLRWRPRLDAAGPFRWVTPTRLGGAGAMVLVAGLVLRSATIAIPGLVLLLAAYLLSIARGRATFQETTGYDKSWRGQPLNTPPRGGRLKRWFRRKD